MVCSKKEYLAREQDVPTAVFHNKHCRTIHAHYNAPPPVIVGHCDWNEVKGSNLMG
ncbi:MAG: hypothetical protein F6K08_28730 [Okeania sp. SIO1H6]|nr:hypothetical protein [Okeania sp. SIO1H6]